MDPLITSERSGTEFFPLVDILIWEKVMKAISGSPWLSRWDHTPLATCLPSAPLCSAFSPLAASVAGGAVKKKKIILIKTF